MEGPALASRTLDCKDLRCPMPIVRISQAVKGMQPGERLFVEATDPAFQADLDAWTKHLGHILVEFQSGAIQRAVIEKS